MTNKLQNLYLVLLCVASDFNSADTAVQRAQQVLLRVHFNKILVLPPTLRSMLHENDWSGKNTLSLSRNFLPFFRLTRDTQRPGLQFVHKSA